MLRYDNDSDYECLPVKRSFLSFQGERNSKTLCDGISLVTTLHWHPIMQPENTYPTPAATYGIASLKMFYCKVYMVF